MNQPATPSAGTEIEPQPCERCHMLVPPLHAGAIVPYFVCPESQTVECLDRARALRAEMGTETEKSPEET